MERRTSYSRKIQHRPGPGDGAAREARLGHLPAGGPLPRWAPAAPRLPPSAALGGGVSPPFFPTALNGEQRDANPAQAQRPPECLHGHDDGPSPAPWDGKLATLRVRI